MKLSVALLGLLFVMSLSTSTLGQATVIPQYTVIPVTVDNGLNSAVNRVGDTFYSHCSQANCGGFPDGTRFLGRVNGVVRASGKTPGQIDVSFTQAILPNGATVPITGVLSSLSSSAVTTDPQTGRLTAKSTSRSNNNRFIAYGAGAGILIGALTRGNVLTGAILGAAAGYLFGRLNPTQNATNVDVPPGTEFGIMLRNRVSLAAGSGAGPVTTVPPPVVTPEPGPSGGWDVTLSAQQPILLPSGVWMLPFREVMNGIGQPFTYSGSTRSITAYTDRGTFTHVIGSRVLYENGTAISLSVPSRNLGGTLYVPTDFVNVMTGRTATWQPGTRTLEIR